MDSAPESTVEERPEILVVDDEPIIRDVLTDLLTSQGYAVDTAENGSVALQKITERRYNLVLTDLKMPVMGGADMLAALAGRQLKVMVIIMTAFATVETAIQTMKNGAYDYIMKPFKIDELLLVVQRALDKERLERENIQLKEVQRLYQISEAMTSTLTLGSVLQIILETAKQEVEADAVSLVLWNEQEGRWQSEMANVEIPGMQEEDLEGVLDYETLRQFHASGRPVLLAPRDVERFTRRTIDSGRRLYSVVSVPLSFRGRISGMLNLFSFTAGRVFQEGQRKSMVILAGRAASADGGGYPQGKAGKEIPLGARILAVADSYDAMTSDRPYRNAMTVEQAIREIKMHSGSQFDPGIVNAFIAVLREKLPGQITEV